MFFFSSRRRHTRLQGDWSSDVCSSDLRRLADLDLDALLALITPDLHLGAVAGIGQADGALEIGRPPPLLSVELDQDVTGKKMGGPAALPRAVGPEVRPAPPPFLPCARSAGTGV